ncbi:MAG: hypothetical protein R6U44_10585 [Archaeoglobaceae archaeon]
MAHTEDDPYTTDLLAGQDMDVGNVTVWNDATNLYVKYVVDKEGWCMTETHLHVAESADEIPQTEAKGKGNGDSGGNPIPGQFEYTNDTHQCITEYTYEIPLDNFDVNCSEDLTIAAHAVVENVTEAPYNASAVIESNQGQQKDGSDVDDERSDPENALAYEKGEDVSNFFSLGFGGNITVAFDCPINNGEGNDVRIVEDTWGSYPVEKANVSASQDGENWVLLGEANNTVRDEETGIHTVSEFDLGELDWAKYIKVEDTTDPENHITSADGFDLNAVLSLQDCVQEETAWGDGERFTDKGNWATYFNYTKQCCTPGVLWMIGDEEEDYSNDSPYDEFNYPGYSLSDGEPDFADPFLVGTNDTSEFPWNSNWDRGYATDFNVTFDYTGPTADARLTVSWSPGTSDEEQKEVFLDGDSLGTTDVYTGTYVDDWYNGYKVNQDTFEIEDLTEGEHTLNFKHYLGDGTLWDYVKLERVCE